MIGEKVGQKLKRKVAGRKSGKTRTVKKMKVKTLNEGEGDKREAQERAKKEIK